jgi:hypothetical protein
MSAYDPKWTSAFRPRGNAQRHTALGVLKSSAWEADEGLKTANALGLTISRDFLLVAEEVIQ